MIIQPIDTATQRRVVDEVHRYIELCSHRYKTDIPNIDVRFDIKGRSAGMYKVKFTGRGFAKKAERVIRFNPWLFAKYFDDSWHNTIPHEVAHYVADCRFGLKNIRPHGVQWQAIMRDLGVEPTVTVDYDFTGIPLRQQARYRYRCGCREVALTATRHKRVVQGTQVYRCRDCGQTLMYQS